MLLNEMFIKCPEYRFFTNRYYKDVGLNPVRKWFAAKDF